MFFCVVCRSVSCDGSSTLEPTCSLERKESTSRLPNNKCKYKYKYKHKIQKQVQIQNTNTNMSQRAPWKGKRATSRLRVKLRLRATHLVASASRLYLSLSSFSADFCQIFEGLSKQWLGGDSIWINDQSGSQSLDGAPLV